MKKRGIAIPGYRISKDGKLIKESIRKSVSARIADKKSPKTKYVRGTAWNTSHGQPNAKKS